MLPIMNDLSKQSHHFYTLIMILFIDILISQIEKMTGDIMLTFKQDHDVFRYRSVGITITNDHILIHKQEDNSYWSLPGGRCEFHESSEETIIREIAEELGEKITVLRLIWIIENFYTSQKYKYHEIALYYHIAFDDHSRIMDLSAVHQGREAHTKLIFAWHPIDRLHTVNLKPEFLVNGLKNVPKHIEHIVVRY